MNELDRVAPLNSEVQYWVCKERMFAWSDVIVKGKCVVLCAFKKPSVGMQYTMKVKLQVESSYYLRVVVVLEKGEKTSNQTTYW